MALENGAKTTLPRQQNGIYVASAQLSDKKRH